MDGESSLPICEINIVFQGLCRVYSTEAAQELRAKVADVFSRYDTARTQFFGPNLEVVKKLQERALYLLDHYEELPQKDLIIGAVRYFLSRMDSMPDLQPLVGLDDDIFVMNHVLKALGLKDMLISEN